MRYIIGDIHGCYQEYQALMRKLNLSEADEIYVLGDAMDRGPEPIRVIQDLMARPNVIYLLGNHDFAFHHFMRKLCVEVTEENAESQLDAEFLFHYGEYLSDGGEVTVSQFQKLSRWEQDDILEYLEDASLFEEFWEEGRRFVLVHGDLGEFEEGKKLEEYDVADLIVSRADYQKRYFRDLNTYLVTGHTPTSLIPGWECSEVYQGNGHIALDLGCVTSGRIAAYCVETNHIVYNR